MHNRFIQMLGNLIGPHTDGKTRQDIERLISDMQVERDAGPSLETTPVEVTPAVVEDDPQHELVFDNGSSVAMDSSADPAASVSGPDETAPAAHPVSAAPPNEAFVHPIPPVGSAPLPATGDGSAPMVNGQPVEQETLADGPAQSVTPEELASDAPGTAGLT